MTQQVELLHTGRWSYGDAPAYVWVIRQNWDWFHDGSQDSVPHADEHGWSYYALYGFAPDPSLATQRTQTCFSAEEAIALAETLLPAITWDAPHGAR